MEQEGLEELLHVKGQEGWRPRGTTLRSRLEVARRSHPMPEARGSGREEQPHVQGAELSHVEGQEGRR